MSDPCERKMQFLVSDHLRPDLRPIVIQCKTLGYYTLNNIPHNSELTIALNELIIKAKDSFVRAMLYEDN